MSMLHTVNKSPFEKNSLASCVDHAIAGSAILLIEDGVYGAQRSARAEALISDALTRCQVFVLRSDLRARGLDEDEIIEGISVVDYSGFVDLAVEHDTVNAWL
ncbi:MAG: sulfurtransferase complex subunit TusB [Chromatiales bacterium]|jgi:tRNA 2-thiouridine synthesizing protein B|nr:sulfurtransferase complex subunit TusB [Chromatiales bacterium]